MKIFGKDSRRQRPGQQLRLGVRRTSVRRTPSPCYLLHATCSGFLLLASCYYCFCLPAVAQVKPSPPSFTEPFASDSCWKTPVAADADFVDVQHEWAKLAVNAPGIETDRWTVAVYAAQKTDPEVKVLVCGPKLWGQVASKAVLSSGNSPEVEATLRAASTGEMRFAQPYYAVPATLPYNPLTSAFRPTIRCPKGAVPSPDSDGHLVVVQPDGHTVFEAYCAVSLSNGDIACGLAISYDLAGPGDGSVTGLRASMMPGLGGLIRTGELARGEVRHALACMLPRGCMQWGSHVWPALAHDTNSGYSGSIPMGARLAIPPTVDLTRVGLSAKGLTLARALQQFGMFVVDRGGEGMTIDAELGDAEANSKTGYPEWWGTDGPKLLKLLKMVRPPATGYRAVQFAPDGSETSEAYVTAPTDPTLRVGPGQPFADPLAALAALPPAGGTIRIAPGHYEINQSLRLNSHTALIGEGKGVEIAMAPGVIAHIITNADYEKGNNQIVIRNLTLIGNLNSKGTPPGNDNPMRGKDNARGIYFVGVKDALVEDCTITETASNSFRADNSTRVRCSHNTVRYCWHCFNFTHSTNCLIVNNTYERQWSGEGVYFNNSDWCLISGNSAKGVGAPGICLEFNSTHNIVSGNTLEACYMQGIALMPGCNDNSVLKNTCRGNGHYRGAGRPDGIYLEGASGNLIAGNHCLDGLDNPSQRYGINVSGAGCKDNTLVGNVCEGNYLGPVRDTGVGTVLTAP